MARRSAENILKGLISGYQLFLVGQYAAAEIGRRQPRMRQGRKVTIVKTATNAVPDFSLAQRRGPGRPVNHINRVIRANDAVASAERRQYAARVALRNAVTAALAGGAQPTELAAALGRSVQYVRSLARS